MTGKKSGEKRGKKKRYGYVYHYYSLDVNVALYGNKGIDVVFSAEFSNEKMDNLNLQQ